MWNCSTLHWYGAMNIGDSREVVISHDIYNQSYIGVVWPHTKGAQLLVHQHKNMVWNSMVVRKRGNEEIHPCDPWNLIITLISQVQLA